MCSCRSEVWRTARAVDESLEFQTCRTDCAVLCIKLQHPGVGAWADGPILTYPVLGDTVYVLMVLSTGCVDIKHRFLMTVIAPKSGKN